MQSRTSKPILIVVLVAVIAAAAAYLFLGPGREAFSGSPRAPGEKIELKPTPEHPADPRFGGGGQ